MSWELVAQTLILLAAGVGASKVIAREPRPIIVAPVRDAHDAVTDSLSDELEQLSMARDQSLKEHASMVRDGYYGLARSAWDEYVKVCNRIRAVQKELDGRKG